MMLTTIEQLNTEIKSFIDKIEPIIKQDETLKELRLGWRIWYSKFIERPKFLFIGINPGDCGGNFEDFTESEMLEYINPDENNYTLAKETQCVFDSLNAINLLQESAKINYYFIKTKGTGELNDFLNRLHFVNFEIWQQFISNSAKWTQDLINLMNPKSIICEGKTTYDNINDNLFLGEKDWLEVKPWNGSVGAFQRSRDNLVLLGYKRTYSNITNKEELADYIKMYCEL